MLRAPRWRKCPERTTRDNVPQLYCRPGHASCLFTGRAPWAAASYLKRASKPPPAPFGLPLSRLEAPRDGIQTAANAVVLQRFTSFIRASRTTSVPLLVYYLDAVKALKATDYANSVTETLGPLDGLGFSQPLAELTANKVLQEKADRAFDELVREELPAFTTHTWIRMASLSINKRITGTLSTHLREISEGLAEDFCLTDPTRADNPIVFASEGMKGKWPGAGQRRTLTLPELYRTTQYGRDYIIGRNCCVLQGPVTSTTSTERLRRNLASGKESTAKPSLITGEIVPLSWAS
jgi:hypothetical protein